MNINYDGRYGERAFINGEQRKGFCMSFCCKSKDDFIFQASSTSSGKSSNGALIGATSASIILLVLVLLIVLVYFKRFRGGGGVKKNIFNKTCSRIQKDDEEDLVNDDL